MRVRIAYNMFEMGRYRTRGIETRGAYGVLHRDPAVASSDQFRAPPHTNHRPWWIRLKTEG